MHDIKTVTFDAETQQVVPKVPTQEMLDAGRNATRPNGPPPTGEQRYIAMLAAAPTPAAQSAGQEAVARYIVIGYGESDYPVAAFANDADGLLDAVLGMVYTKPTDACEDTREEYRRALADADEWCAEVWRKEFEIGGIVVYDTGERAAPVNASEPVVIRYPDACIPQKDDSSFEFAYGWNSALARFKAMNAAPVNGGERYTLTADQWLDLAQRHANSDWNSDKPDGFLIAVKALCSDFADTHSAPLSESERALAQVIDERDRTEVMADKLADAIGEYFGIEIGEHSSVNSPWQCALDFITTAERETPRCSCCGYLVTESEHRGCLRAADAPQPDYAALEREHFGDPDKRTGIYAADAQQVDGDEYGVLHRMAYIMGMYPEGETIPFQVLEVLRKQYRAAMQARAALTSPAKVPGAVMQALDRMSTPLHDSRLSGLTAELDAANIKTIRDYVLSGAVPAKVVGDDQHPDDAAVDRFSVAMKAKLAKKRAQGRGGWDDERICSPDDLARMLVDHVRKGDPVDVGNLAMMLFNRPDAGAALCRAALSADGGDRKVTRSRVLPGEQLLTFPLPEGGKVTLTWPDGISSASIATLSEMLVANALHYMAAEEAVIGPKFIAASTAKGDAK